MKDITSADYIHVKTICKDLEAKIGEYDDLYV